MKKIRFVLQHKIKINKNTSKKISFKNLETTLKMSFP